MACTESNWSCEPSSILGSPSCHSTFGQGGQPVDDAPQSEEPRASRIEKYRKIARFHGRSWQQSFDSQEFGFSYNLVEPADVAPADELFYKGQILPLQTDTRLHAVQALSSCMLENSEAAPHTHAGRPSSVNKDDEVRFSSCRIEGVMGEKLSTTSNALVAMRSLSFRSQHSGYWESGAEKDTTDTSSSSRDSNGSSQDSYIPHANTVSHINFKVKPSLIPWKSFFGGLMKASRRQHNPRPSLPVVAFSEDLSKYRPVGGPLLAEAKVGLAPLMLDKDMGLDTRQAKVGLKSNVATNQCRFRGEPKGKCAQGDDDDDGILESKSGLQKDGAEDGESKSKSETRDSFENGCNSENKEGSSRASTAKTRFARFNNGRSLKTKSTIKEASRGTTKPKDDAQTQRKGGVRERWQGYARKLKPLYEVKKGLMGQFRMDECGKNACEVESGGIIRRPSWQRRLSHQSSFYKNHKKLNIDHEESNVESSAYYGSNNSMQMAMSSCPPSTRCSPNHSGVLAGVGDNKLLPKHAQGGGNYPTFNANSKKNVSNELISMSTMHELHSAVQSAIAHCKESNKSYYLD